MRRKYRISGLTSQATRELTWVSFDVMYFYFQLFTSCSLWLYDWFLFYSFCISFPVDDRGTVKSVVEYFYETYGFVIQHTQWPCLQVGNQQRPNYLPMEVSICPYVSHCCLDILVLHATFWKQVCKIVEGQRYSKRLNERQITALLKVTCQRPHERELDIMQVCCCGRNCFLCWLQAFPAFSQWH